VYAPSAHFQPTQVVVLHSYIFRLQTKYVIWSKVSNILQSSVS